MVGRSSVFFFMLTALIFFKLHCFFQLVGALGAQPGLSAKSLIIVLRFFAVAQPDIQLAISFLCKRVKNPNTGDWVNLGRVV